MTYVRHCDVACFAKEILADYALDAAVVTKVDSGLINATFLATLENQRFIVQRVNPIFGPRVNDDIHHVTLYLAEAGMLTPCLLPTSSGQLYTKDNTGQIWRVMTFIEGVTHERATEPSLCRSAGELVGRFHRIVSTLSYEFLHKRLFIHDTTRHLATLKEALSSKRTHANVAAIAPLGEKILEQARQLPSLPSLPKRIVHGDLKISNILFSPEGRALALVDLDTLGKMPLPIELADAWRSWCNPSGEDDPNAHFRIDYLEAAIVGYAQEAGGLFIESEVSALPWWLETIALELAARFCADALLESYFAWDSTRFSCRSEHNLVRATSQWRLACQIKEARSTITELVNDTLMP